MAWLLKQLWNRTGLFTLRPAGDIRLVDPDRSVWQVTGADPQLLLQSKQFPLPPGRYRFVALGGSDLIFLQDAMFYIDFGKGFQENTGQQIEFLQDASGEFFTELVFDHSAIGLRFDPASGSLPLFGLNGFRCSRVKAVEQSRAIGLTERPRPKVLLNLFRLLPADAGAGGAGRVCMALLTYLPEFVSLKVIISLYHSDLQREFAGVDFVVTSGDSYDILAGHLEWCDCYFDPLNALRPIYIPQHIPVLGLLYDLQHMHLPWFFSDAELELRFREYGYVAHRANMLLAISHFERENFERFYGVRNVAVVHLSGFLAENLKTGGAEGASVPQDPEKYLIYPAIPWFHKNHSILLQALAILRRRGVEVRLLMTNARAQNENAKRLAFAATLFGIEHLVMIEGFLDEEELGNRLLASSGLVFPSLYEGFGIPLVDALKLGIPILASRSASIPEVCGQACSYFGNARNALAVADDLEAFWQDEDRRAHQKRNGLRQGARYSSRKMASEISRVITDTIGTAREEASNAGASFNFVPPQRRRLAVFVAYEENDGLDGIREVSDIHRYHIGLFGEAASITVGLDLRLAEDKRVAALFRKAPNLIAFDATTMEGRDAAVYDFSTRYDDAEYHLVVKHPSSAVKYSPSRLDEMLTALELHPRAGFAILDPEVADIIVEAPPTEREGCLRYETIREAGFAVYDRLIRRAGVLRGLSNGTAQFLSVIATRAELLRFPWLSGTVEHN